MTDTHKVIKYKGYTINIYPDDAHDQGPSEWGDTELFLIGDHNQFYVNNDLIDDIHNLTTEDKKKYHIIPLIAYIHSGVSLSITNESYPFNDKWDSCQVGYVFISKKDTKSKIKAKKLAKELINDWNMYLTGNVYGFIVFDPQGEEIGSCWGFYGEPKDSDIINTAKGEINCDLKEPRYKITYNKLEEITEIVKAESKDKAIKQALKGNGVVTQTKFIKVTKVETRKLPQRK